MADQPVALAPLAPLGPAEAARALVVAIQQAARREALAVDRIDLGFVAAAQLDGIEAELAGEFVHRAFDREGADRLARCAHRAGGGQVEADEIGAEAPRLAGIERQRAERDRFEEAGIVVLRGDAFVREGGDAPVFGGADADALRRRRTVVDEIGGLRARQRDLDRPPDLFGGDRGEDHLRPDAGLAAEAAADERREHAHILGREGERLGDGAAGGTDHLVAGADQQLAVSPGDGAGMRFERGGIMDRRRVAAVEHHRGGGQRRIEIADVDRRQEAELVVALHRLRVLIEAIAAGLGMDDDQRRGVAGDALVGGDDDRDRLAVMEDRIGIAMRRGLRIAAAGDHARVAVDHREHAGHVLRGGAVDGGDPAAADRRADDRGISGVRVGALIGVAGGAADLRRPFDARHRRAEHALPCLRQPLRPVGAVHRHLVHRVDPLPGRVACRRRGRWGEGGIRHHRRRPAVRDLPYPPVMPDWFRHPPFRRRTGGCSCGTVDPGTSPG